MPTDSQPISQTESAAMEASVLDYATLRQEGIRQLERLAGAAWTDFNEHDPGITILEQFCYALSELAYRCDFPLPDLLSRDGLDPYRSLFSPARILSSCPVTLTDLRKLAVDVPGVKNAWIEKMEPISPVFLAQDRGAGEGRVIQWQDGDAAEPVKLKGLYRVLIEPSGTSERDNSAAIIRNVARRLHAHRPLGMDFDSVRVMEPQSIRVKASIEIGPDGQPDEIYAAVMNSLAQSISPSIRFYTLAERRAAGLSIDEIFEGPLLTQGFIDSEELARLERQTALRVSDLISAVMAVDGVRMVKHLVVSGNGGENWENWWLELADQMAPMLDRDNSMLTLQRGHIEIGVDYPALKARLTGKAQTSPAHRPAQPEALDLIPPPGRDRRVGRYYSAQHHFPEVYGLGAIGLPPRASEERRAQLKQLQAYLLFFDQLLGNQFAQLAHLGDLLGFDETPPQTYFAADLNDPDLRLGELWRTTDPSARRAWLARIVEDPLAGASASAQNPPVDWQRKHRLLDHLLARLAERFPDHGQFRQKVKPKDDKQADNNSLEILAHDKQAWLRHYPELSAARGTGFNALQPWDGSVGPDFEHGSGLEWRLRIKLGLRSTQEERFYLLEHSLLRPLTADRDVTLTQVEWPPLLVDASRADPYSLQVSLVFPAALARRAGDGFRRFVEQTVRSETPVHLLVYVHWLNKDDMAAFESAHAAWLASQRELRLGNDQQSLSLAPDSDDKRRLAYKLRDARDRLLELLTLGRTYPLADLPVAYIDTVAWGQVGSITIFASQADVLYQLLDKDRKPSNPPIEDHGNGADLVLPTPTISKDSGYVILATKFQRRLCEVMADPDGVAHLADSRLDTRYELWDSEDTSGKPIVDVTGTGEALALALPSGSGQQKLMLRSTRSLSLALFNTIDIKVGLDLKLVAAILDGGSRPPDVADPNRADPRLVDYGVAPRIEVQASQAGVDYSLVRLGADSDGDGKADLVSLSAGEAVRGDSHAIILPAIAMTEDVEIRVLAVKTFGARSKRQPQSDLLNLALPLKVRPNPALSIAAPPILEYGGKAVVTVKQSQASTSYQVYARPIRDDEFVRDAAAPAKIGIEGVTGLWVTDPPNPLPERRAISALKAGTGDDLVLEMDSLTEDSLVVVQATKAHLNPQGERVEDSSLQLTQAAVVLVRPGSDHDFALRLEAKDSAQPTGTGLVKDAAYRVLNGQPGVYYHFQLADQDLGRPVYFHKTGKGIGQLAVEIDFTLTGGLPTPPPQWDCPNDLDAATRLTIRAVKAQTGQETVYQCTVAALLGQA